MKMLMSHRAGQVAQLGRRLGNAAAVSILLASTAAYADEPPAPADPAAASPPPAVAAPSAAAPVSGQPPSAGHYAPPPSYRPPVLGPEVLPAKGGVATPLGYHAEERIVTGDVICGATMFGNPYMLSVGAGVMGVSGGSGAWASMFVPVAGPFIMAGLISRESANPASATQSIILMTDGVLQASGAAFLAYALLTKNRVFVRDQVAKSFVMPTPMQFGANSAGLGVVGTF